MNVGYSVTDITPEPGMPMAGYVERKGYALGAHDPLHARVVYLEDSDEILIISLDVIRVDDQLRDRLAYTISSCTGVKKNNILIAATHTHSGPEVSTGLWSTRELTREEYKLVDSYVSELAHKLCTASITAIENASKVTAIRAEGHHVSGVASNRVNPRGPIDPEALLILFETEYGRIALLNYACHPTVLGPSNLLYSGDISGLTASIIEEEAGIHTVYLNGAAGNVSTRYSRMSQSFSEAWRLSRIIASSVIEGTPVWKMELKPYITPVSVKTLELKTGVTVAPEEFSKLESVFEERLKKAVKEGASEQVIQDLRSRLYAIRIVRRRLSMLPLRLRAEVYYTSIGGLPLLTFPGELFVEYQLEVKKRRKCMLVGYANGYIGYIPYPSYRGAYSYEEIVSIVHPDEQERILSELVEVVEEVAS